MCRTQKKYHIIARSCKNKYDYKFIDNIIGLPITGLPITGLPVTGLPITGLHSLIHWVTGLRLHWVTGLRLHMHPAPHPPHPLG